MHYDVAKYVVSNSKEIKAGWYGSFDWLQNPNWADDPNSFVPGTMDEFMAEREKEYQKALFYKVGRDRIQKLHKEVNKYGKGNVAEPDLWLIKKDESFQFIEVKIDRTRTSLAQINALKLLSKVLEADVRIVRFVKK